jgi:hypothetical protein
LILYIHHEDAAEEVADHFKAQASGDKNTTVQKVHGM